MQLTQTKAALRKYLRECSRHMTHCQPRFKLEVDILGFARITIASMVLATIDEVLPSITPSYKGSLAAQCTCDSLPSLWLLGQQARAFHFYSWVCPLSASSTACQKGRVRCPAMFQQTHELIGNISESLERFFKIPCKDRERTQVTSIQCDADVMSILPGKKICLPSYCELLASGHQHAV